MARTAEQNEHMKEVRKEKIRAEALRQFAEKGLFATRIQDIATSAEMSQGLLYHYYPSKDAIFADLINDALDKTNKAAAGVREMELSAKEKILLSLRELFKTIETSPRFRETCRFIAQAVNSTAIPSEAKVLLEEKRDLPYQIMAEIMKQGQAEGTVVEGDPEALAILFWTSINGLSIYQATRDDTKGLPGYELLSRLFLKD